MSFFMPNWNRIAIACAAVLSLPFTAVHAAENGLGFYLLGSKGALAALLPPPGVYFQNDAYFYSGSLGGNRQLPLGGVVGAGIKARAFIDLPTVLWVTPYEVLGGNLAFSLTTPIGGPNVNASLILGPFAGGRSDSLTTFGDPVASAMLGWKSGNFHWSLSGMANVPIGDYQKGALANIAFHRWAGDLSAAGTWLDPNIGLDISGVIGVTFNGKNTSTEYRTGTELHIEGAVSQYFTKEFSVGAIGYYYQQISDDSGPGAKLGSFRGRVAALGPTASYTFNVGIIPVTARLKVVREFHTENRLQGTAAWLSLAMPLYVNTK
ncbi:transporter [Roseiarcaceae bacterium H3SJ34-1]|uniref:SphA family protein n=1 Tax=Terripilifer ovatus TaxID=3032367 RepID=UPI003AB9B9F0|nr:transporter [Roseiarcaceae bacterium H3SJ34-1]